MTYLPMLVIFGALVGDSAPRMIPVCGCHPGGDGLYRGGTFLVPEPEQPPQSFSSWPVVTIESNGVSANRIDLVFVGDGFQVQQLGQYAYYVGMQWAEMSGREPFASYRTYFNVHRVDVVSLDSGVDHDPKFGILRNTQLDMGFWTSGVQNRLSVDLGKVRQAAANAPDADQYVALANSSVLGGLAYPGNDICTTSRNDFSGVLLLHEFGHAFGYLADEYWTPGTTYSGAEINQANLSILTASAMQVQGVKWAAWLGTTLPQVGLHGAFEGGGYHEYGIRRPTQTSIMRSADPRDQYNGPSLEQLISRIHQETQMLDAATLAPGSVAVRGDMLSVTLLQPASHELSVQWFLGEDAIPGGTSHSLDTSLLPVPGAGQPLRLVIVDPSPLVRSESVRHGDLTETYTWHLLPDGCRADLNLDGAVDGADLGLLLVSWGQGGIVAGRADVDGSGSVDGADLGLVLTAWGQCGAALDVYSVHPSMGPVEGGSEVTVTGRGFNGIYAVTFDDLPGSGIQVLNDTTIKLITPPGSKGSSSVRVIGSGGAATLENGFTYVDVVVPSWASLLEAEPNPEVVTDLVLRDAIAATGLAWRVKHTMSQLEMVLIPPGVFQMGCIEPALQAACYSSESPVHDVTLTNPFYIGRYEVTQAQWSTMMGSNPSHFQSASSQVPAVQVPLRPVEQVSWNTVQAFLVSTGLRLPTEAEWEYAYRAGTTKAFHGAPGFLSGTNDMNLLSQIAWFDGNSLAQTRPVGGKAGNGFGLHDMAGNVNEWVSDWHGSSYYSSSPSVNPTGPTTGNARQFRGGHHGLSWGGSGTACRASARTILVPSGVVFSVGFRAARNP